MTVNPITAAISDYRAQEIAAKAAGKTDLAFELGNMIVGLESLAQAHETRVAPLTAPVRKFYAQREDHGGAKTIVGVSRTVRDLAIDDAMAEWEKSGNANFFAFPIFTVVDQYGATSVEPIDCFPYEV